MIYYCVDKKIFFADLFLIFCFGTAINTPCAFGQSGLKINVEEIDGSITIVKSTGTAKTLVIPDTINELPVTVIGDGAFNNRGLEALTIPDSVTTIGNSAFANNKLATVVIGDNVVSIGRGAFSGNKLREVTLGNGLSSIGPGAFSGNQLSVVTIPENISSIEDYAFFSNKIKSITIPDTVRTIGEGAFSGNKIASVIIGSGVTGIGAGAFYNNPINSVTIPNTVTALGRRAFDSRTAGGGLSRSVDYLDADGKVLFTSANNFDTYYSSSGKRSGKYTLTRQGWEYGE
ncbi:hypothetical protein AGMMS50268_05360 [Spirochaetia bacterium]|nr:hypothetical protein AGMMS50268_05360 [Spirochaetia bacterium]